MKRIIFVGRHDLSDAPFAAFFFEKLLAEHGLSEKYVIVSRAGRPGYLGSPVNTSVRSALAELEIDCSSKHSELLSADDLPDSLILCTSSEAMRAVLSRFPESASRIHLLNSYLLFSEQTENRFDDPKWNTLLSACRGLFSDLLRHDFSD